MIKIAALSVILALSAVCAYKESRPTEKIWFIFMAIVFSALIGRLSVIDGGCL